MKHLSLTCSLIGLVVVTSGLTRAQAPAAPTAPSAGAETPARGADAILDDFATALGKQALAKHKSLYMKRAVSVKAMGVEGTEERWANASGKYLLQMTLPGVGTMKSGSTGTGKAGVRWSEDPINGLRILKGAEDEQARMEASWNAELQLKQLFKTREVQPAPAGAPKDRPLECVRLTPAQAAPVTMCFDATTHLISYQEGKQQSPQGEVPYAVKFSDWREIQGVKRPHREEMTVGPMSLDAKLTEVQFGAKIDPTRFKMPKPAKP
jgi:hypothetical protein